MPNDSAVKYFELTLHWPLRFFVPKGLEESAEKTDDALDRLVEVVTKADKSPWHEVTDTFVRDRRKPSPDAKPSANAKPNKAANSEPPHYHDGETSTTHYAEGVYFHPFIQKLLYGTGRPDGRPPYRLLTRTDVKVVQVLLRRGQPLEQYEVRKVDLYLLSSEVAVLVVSIKGKPCSFDDYLTLSAWLRRTYPPFWSDYQKEQSSDATNRPGFCPEEVIWGEGLGDKAKSNHDYKESKFFTDHFIAHRSPTPAQHWKFLLEPLEIWAGERDEKLRYQLLGDERISLMSFVAFEGIRKLTRGDWMRLVACEAAGTWHLPYAEAFVSDFETRYCYDRFWSAKDGDPKKPYESYLKELTTRFLVSEHSFCMAIEPTGENPWGMRCDEGMLAQFRHQYFELCLLAQVQHSSLLVFSDRLADSVQGNADKYDASIAIIAQEFALFIDRFWVGEVTNQIQGKELFELQVKQLGTPKLFDQVKGEIDFVHQYLTGQRNERATNSQVVLSTVAYWGLSVSALLGFLGMNVFIDPILKDFQCWGWTVWQSHLAVFLGSFLLFGVIVGFIWGRWIDPGMRGKDRREPS